ncbi:MAG: hypothetical protein R3Y09_06550 [Clostridia bacterium]
MKKLNGIKLMQLTGLCKKVMKETELTGVYAIGSSGCVQLSEELFKETFENYETDNCRLPNGYNEIYTYFNNVRIIAIEEVGASHDK